MANYVCMYDVNRMTTQIEVRGNKKFDDVNRNNGNRGDVNRRITVLQREQKRKLKFQFQC